MTLPVTTTGPADAPAVLLLHGFMGARADWAEVAARIAGPLRCIAIDLPGHGEAVGLPDEAYTPEGMAAAVLATLDNLGIDRAHVLGYSMGGRLALWLGVHHSDRTGRLVLVSASPGLRTDAERAERRRLDEERAVAIETDFSAFLHDWARLPIFVLDDRAARDAFVAARQWNHPDELARSLRGFGTGQQPSLWPFLDRLTAPGLAVAGGRDRKFVSLAFEMAAHGPTIKPLVVPAGHALVAERPDLVAAMARHFLASPVVSSPLSDPQLAL